MPIRLPRRRLLAAAGAMPFVRSAAAAVTPAKGGTLVVALGSEPGDLFAPSVYSQATVVPGGKLFDTLLRWRLDDSFAPALASSWEVAADGHSFTFHLRDGVRFHDGHPLTAEDVVFTVNELWRKTHALNRVALADLVSVEAPDPRTVIFRMATPTPAFPLLSTLSVFGQIAPKHIYGTGELRRNPAINAPVGSGPYRMQSWDRGNTILMERNKDYWDKSLPYLDQIQFQIMPDPQARSAALETGDVQAGVYSPIPASDQRRLEAMPSLVFDRAGNRSTAGTFVSELNLRRKELADVRVRRALSLALDRDFIVRVVLDGHGAPADSPIPHASHLHDPGLPVLAYDPAQANALLDQAGFPRGANGIRFRLRLDPSPTQTAFASLADYMKQAFAAVGIGIDIRVADLVTRNRWVYTDYDFDMTILSLGCIVDPVVSVINSYWSKGIQKGVVLANVGDYRSAEMDAVIEAARIELDESKRIALFHRFQQIAVADMVLLPMVDNDSYNIFSSKVGNHSVTPVYPIDNWCDIWLAS